MVIIQIAVDGDPNSQCKIIGLGEDNRVYLWIWTEEKWVLASRKEKPEPSPYPVPRKKHK